MCLGDLYKVHYVTLSIKLTCYYPPNYPLGSYGICHCRCGGGGRGGKKIHIFEVWFDCISVFDVKNQEGYLWIKCSVKLNIVIVLSPPLSLFNKLEVLLICALPKSFWKFCNSNKVNTFTHHVLYRTVILRVKKFLIFTLLIMCLLVQFKL